MISPDIVGEPLEIDRQFDAVNCVMSLMVSIVQTSMFYST
jgi:hypothetical protein